MAGEGRPALAYRLLMVDRVGAGEPPHALAPPTGRLKGKVGST